MLWYFAYGSNMSPAIFRERRAITPLETQRAHLDGYRVCFDIPVGPGERGVANLEVVPGARTHGVAYLLAPDVCEHLDHTEGVHVGLYTRLPVTVVADGRPLDAFTYQSTRTTTGRKPSPRYLGLLLDGARMHALPAEYVAWLEGLERAVDEREPDPA